MGLFDNEGVFFVESGKRALKLAAEMGEPEYGGLIAISSTDRGDGVWVFDMTGDTDKAWIGRGNACDLIGPADDEDESLSRAFPFVVFQHRSWVAVLVEDAADLPRVLRSAGADRDKVLTLNLEALARANAMLDDYRIAARLRRAPAIRSAQG